MISRARASEFLIPQFPTRPAIAGPIDSQHARINGSPIFADRAGWHLYHLARPSLDRHAASFNEQLPFNNVVVLTVRVLIGPRFSPQLPLE